MVFKVDHSRPEDSKDHHWAEVTYDGAPNSWVPEIGSHWHKNHDEYMEVLQGRIDFTLDGQTTTLTPGDPPLHIPKLHVHSFKFIKGVPTTFTEKTMPVGDFKEKFFGELLSSEDGTPNLWTVMRSFYEGDTFLALPGGWKGLDENVTWAMGRLARWWEPGKKNASS